MVGLRRWCASTFIWWLAEWKLSENLVLLVSCIFLFSGNWLLKQFIIYLACLVSICIHYIYLDKFRNLCKYLCILIFNMKASAAFSYLMCAIAMFIQIISLSLDLFLPIRVRWFLSSSEPSKLPNYFLL